jgi:hypothetical protein
VTGTIHAKSFKPGSNQKVGALMGCERRAESRRVPGLKRGGLKHAYKIPTGGLIRTPSRHSVPWPSHHPAAAAIFQGWRGFDRSPFLTQFTRPCDVTEESSPLLRCAPNNNAKFHGAGAAP